MLLQVGAQWRDARWGDKYTGAAVIAFQTQVVKTEEYYIYDGLSMVGEAGGYLGLFLGVSCCQLIDLLIKRLTTGEAKVVAAEEEEDKRSGNIDRKIAVLSGIVTRW